MRVLVGGGGGGGGDDRWWHGGKTVLPQTAGTNPVAATRPAEYTDHMHLVFSADRWSFVPSVPTRLDNPYLPFPCVAREHRRAHGERILTRPIGTKHLHSLSATMSPVILRSKPVPESEELIQCSRIINWIRRNKTEHVNSPLNGLILRWSASHPDPCSDLARSFPNLQR